MINCLIITPRASRAARLRRMKHAQVDYRVSGTIFFNSFRGRRRWNAVQSKNAKMCRNERFLFTRALLSDDLIDFPSSGHHAMELKLRKKNYRFGRF